MKKNNHHLSHYVVLLTYLLTFGEAAFSKRQGVPDWFLSQFRGSIIDFGDNSLKAAFIAILLLETITFLLFLIGLIKKELQKSAFIMAQFTFVVLMFGLRISHKYSDAGLLFLYALGTFIYLEHFLKQPNQDLHVS